MFKIVLIELSTHNSLYGLYHYLVLALKYMRSFLEAQLNNFSTAMNNLLHILKYFMTQKE